MTALTCDDVRDLAASYVLFFNYRTAAETYDTISRNHRFSEDDRRKSARNAVLLYANIGDTERAFALLDKAYAERDWMLRDLKVSPMWDPLRNDPRFARLLKQMRLD